MIGEKIVTRSQEYAESIINTVREPLIVLDQDLRVVSVSRSFYEVFKVNPEETVGQLIYDLDNKEWDIPRLRELLETILPQKTAFDDYEVEHVFFIIFRRIMLLNARQIEREMGKERIILLAIEDITEHKRLEGLVAESEERYMRYFETASDGIMLLEKREGHIVHANPAAEKMLGYTEEESIGKNLQDIGVLLDTSDFQEIMRSLNKSGILNYDDVPVKTRSGQDIYTDIYMVDGVRLAQCNIRDISERKQKEENIQRMNRTLLARSKSSKAMISASDEAGYLDEVCRIIVEDCGHALVWIGFAEQNEGRSVRPVAHAGFDEGYLDLANITWSDTDRGRGPVGTAIRTGKPSVIRDILGGPAFAPWRDEAIKRGYAAVIGVPFLTAGKAFGSLNIYSRHQDPFSEDEVRLLIDLAADLSYGIAAIRLRTAQAEAEVALRESEKRFKLITETISEVFWMADSQSDKMLYISPGYELVWGRSLQSLYENPHSYIEAIHADDRARVHADHEVKTIGQAFDHEYRILRPDGTIRWVWDRGFPIYEPTGEVFRYVGIAQDITEYKILQEQHLQITREWEETFDTITDMVTVHDKDFNIIRANKAAEKMLGFSFLDAKKIKCFEYYHGTGCPPEGCPSCQTLVTGKACITELFEPHLNMFIEIRAIPRLDSNNQLVGLIHVVRDISERKKAETMLREERNNAQMYLDLAGVMIVALNSGGRITLINKKGLEILGYEEHEVVNRNWFELCIPGCVKEDVEGTFNKLMAGNIKPVEFYENSIITKGGEERILAFHNTLLWDVSGKKSGTLSSGEDITERKKAEEEQKKLEAQLRHAQKMEAVGTLAGGVAHDFNNILNIIIGYGNMVMDKLEAGSPSIKNMSEVLIAADRAVNLTKRLLIFSRKQDVEVKPININELILGLQKMLVRIIRESIDIDLDLVDSPLIVQADAGQIEQVLINLAVNAKDA
ncbi:MAG: PAS domain S-box protein, partial [Deltaproteobacteria bacterium]|nr:PAS domain S-box protein [Deltaproteobacteria bacterium]